MQNQDPIRLAAFRQENRRLKTSAMDRQLRLSLGLVALLLAATATVGLSTVMAKGKTAPPAAQAIAHGISARG